MLHYQIIPVTAYQQNCTLLWDDQTMQAVLIDAGGEVPRLLDIIKSRNLTLVALWLTHGHLDHAGGVGHILKMHNIPVIGPHKGDDFWLKGFSMQAQMMGATAPPDFAVTQWLKGGEVLTLGEYQFEVRFTPGHTPGHVVIYSKDLNLVWTGDVLFAGSIGRTDFPQGDFDTLIHSIKTQLFTLPPETQFICGHGPMSTIGHEVKTNPFLAGRAG